MANKVNVEISANVEGFVQGVNTATQSAEKYETETRKIADATGNFRAEFIKAKKEVQNLAIGYARLSKEAKQSEFGMEMKKQLDAAKESAAQLIDMQGDMQAELKNLASDTRLLDTFGEGFGVLANAASAASGAIATFTGNEDDARNAVLMFTTAQSALAAMTKIQNALQMQSNTMLAVTKVQSLAAAAAINIKTAAEGKSVATTKAATVAQALFNKIAYANPYVLLAMAIVAVTAALATFIVASHKAADVQEEETKATERAKAVKDAYYNTYNDNLSKTIGNYSKLQGEWKDLKSESEKNQWIKDNADAFHELGFEINDTADAEKLFVQNEAKVISSFVARAEAAALAAQQVEIFNQALKDIPQVGEKKSASWFGKQGLSVKGRADKSNWYNLDYEYEFTEADRQQILQNRMAAAREDAEKLGKLRLEAEKKSAMAQAETGVKTYNKKRNDLLKKSSKSTSSKIEVKIEEGSLAEAEAKLKKLEELRTKMSVDSPDMSNVISAIEKTKTEIENKKIQLKIEAPKTSTQYVSEFEKKLRDAQAEAESNVVKAMITNDTTDLATLIESWEKATEAVDKYNTQKQLLIQGVQVTGDKQLQDVVNKNIPKTIKSYQNAISTLQEQIDNIDWDNIEGEGDTWQEYIDLIRQYKKELLELQGIVEDAIVTPQEEAQDAGDKTNDTFKNIGDTVRACGDMFDALGQAADDEGIKVMGIVAQAVATVALSFANALKSCSTWWEWLAFGATGLATMLTMISSIKSATGGYDSGGIIGGSDYHGDRILARVESGELVLNKRQQKNLFDLLDHGTFPQSGGANVHVTGVISGTDIMLVQKNTNKVRRTAGTQIHF